MFKNIKKIIIGLAILATITPVAVFAARTDALWDYPNGSNYYKPNGSPSGVDILMFGSNRYLNFNAVTGSSGYGFRDNAGTIEFKNSGGSWTGVGTGGSGGTDGNWSFFNGSGIKLATTSNQVLIGASATTSTANLEVIGNGYFSGKVGIGMTNPQNTLVVSLPAVGNNSYLQLSSATANSFNSYLGTTASNQYAWFTNVKYSGSAFVRDDLTKTAWRMNQVVDTADQFQLDHWDTSDNIRSTFNIGGDGSFSLGGLSSAFAPPFTGSALVGTAGGNVGIASSTPTYKLSIGTGSSFAFFNPSGVAGDVKFEVSDNNPQFIFNNTGGAGTFPQFVLSQTGTSEAYWFWSPTLTEEEFASVGAISFSGGGLNTRQVYLNSTGQLGVGTTSPSGRLTVGNSWTTGSTAVILQTNDQFSGSNIANSVIQWKSVDGSNRSFIGSFVNKGDTGNLEFGNNGTTNMILSSTGNLGMNDISPATKLSVVGNAQIGFSSGQTGTTNGLIVNGNTGIGTSNPGSFKLYVNGNQNVNGSLQATNFVGFSTPSILVGGSFTGATATFDANPNTTGATITFKTSTTVATDQPMFTVTFGTAFATTPHCVVSADELNASTVNVYSTTTATTIAVYNHTALSTNTSYLWTYLCIQ